LIKKPTQVVASGGFDDMTSRDIRFLEEASKLGELTVLLWPDSALQRFTGKAPKFLFPERKYFVDSIRYVSKVVEAEPSADRDSLPRALSAEIWADYGLTTNPGREKYARDNDIAYRVFSDENLNVIRQAAVPSSSATNSNRKKVIVTGCYDWLHSGHVRFFEEVSNYGDLYVVVGHDANIRLLKGDGHPLLSQEERRYLVGSIKYVKQALISSGDGWLDADPEIRKLKPDIYAVNDDGDVGGKRGYCAAHGIEYLVLQRIPAPGLPQRTSTELRGLQFG
jgi:cytidyltransferase-like protein